MVVNIEDSKTEVTTDQSAAAPPLEAPRYRRVGGLGREHLVYGATLGLFCLLALAPIIPTVYQSFVDEPLYISGQSLTWGNYADLLSDPEFGQVALNTAIFAGLTTVLSLLFAVPMAVIIERTNVPGARLLAFCMQWPFFISSLILGFGWITMYGPAGFVSTMVEKLFGGVPWNLYTIPGMALTEAVALAPIVYMFCVNALRNSDASLESAFQICGGGPLGTLRRVVLPMLRPPVVYSSILVCSISVETLSIPLLYGQPVGVETFSTYLYKNGLQSINADYGILGAAATMMLMVTVVLVFFQAKLLGNAKRFVAVRGKATRARRLDLASLRWPAALLIGTYVIGGALVPLGGLIFRSWTLIFTPLANPLRFLTFDNYRRIWEFSAYSDAVYNSLIVAAIGSVVVTILAVVGAMVARRSSFRFARQVEYAALAPQAMPGIIIGLGFFWAFSVLPFGLNGLFQGALLGLVVAFGVRGLPVSFGSIAPSLMQIGGELDDAARVSGADWGRTFVRILASLLKPAVAASLILVFITMMKEYSAAIFLSSADTQVMGTTMLTLWTQGQTGSVAAIAVIQIVITASFAGVARLLLKGHGNA